MIEERTIGYCLLKKKKKDKATKTFFGIIEHNFPLFRNKSVQKQS